MDEHPAFAGFGPGAFAFLTDLAANNSRAFFADRRRDYERELLVPFGAMLHSCAASARGRARVFRQLRDQRFAGNRDAPYWLSIAGEIGDRPGTAAILHAVLSADGLTAAAGYRRPFSAGQLARYRAAAADDVAGTELQAIAEELQRCGIVLTGATLRTAPRGVSRSHPRAALLRHTALTGAATLAPVLRRRPLRTGAPQIEAEPALSHLTRVWAQLDALCSWLDTHVGPAGDRTPAAA